MINIIDGNNWIHVKLNSNTGGSVIRDLYFDTLELPGSTIWVFDGERGNKRRKDLYPLYKANRTPSAEDFYANLQLLKRVLKHTNAMMCEVPGFEGDDVVATLATQLARAEDVTIMSTDVDLLQLTVNPRIASIKSAFAKVDDPQDIHLYKTLVGDTSDNIKGVPGIGDKAFAKVNKEVFEKFCTKPFKLDSPEQVKTLFGVNPAPAKWIYENPQDLQILWLITALYNVPEVEKFMIPGTLDVSAAERVLGEFLL